MAMLLNVAITTAVTLLVGPTYQLRGGPSSAIIPSSMSAQGTATGTAGTNMTWWLQASFDDGISWCDALAGVCTPAVPRVCGVVLSNPTAGVAPAAPTDGGMAAPGVQNGIYAGLWRCKYSSTGTWTLGNLRVDVFSNGVEPST